MLDTVDATKVVGDVFTKAEGLDLATGEVAGGDEAAAEEEEDVGCPGLLSFAGGPELVEESLRSYVSDRV